MQYLLYSTLMLFILTMTYDITPFIFLGAFILMILGLYNPRWVIWSRNPKQWTRWTVLKWYGTVSCIAILIVGTIGLSEQKVEVIRPSTEQEAVEGVIDPIEGPRNQLDVHFIDIGQGDAIFVDYGDFEMLIDGGDNKYGQQVIDYLKAQEVDVIDYVIGTHMDADHIGGLDTVIEYFPVAHVIDSGTEKETKTYKSYNQAVKNENTDYQEDDSFTIEIDEWLSFDIIETGDGYKDENDNSVVVQLNYLDKKFLFTGDMEAHAEEASLKLFEDIDVLKSGHHGSRTSSSEAFLQKTKPEYAVISCGIDNKYGHPHEETLEKYKAHQIEVYRTDLQGHIICTIDTVGKIVWQTQKGY